MPCRPTIEDHCCWISGQPCPFFDAATPNTDRRCTLRTELGSWDLVHQDPRYLRHVAPVWRRIGVVDCGDWAPTGDNPCSACDWDGG